MQEDATGIHSRHFQPKAVSQKPPFALPRGRDADEEDLILGSGAQNTWTNPGPPSARPHFGHQMGTGTGLTTKPKCPLWEEEEGLNWLSGESTAQAHERDKICPFRCQSHEN